MSGISRRQLLSVGTLLGGAALVDAGLNKAGAARLSGHCPGCGANLALAEIHGPDCTFARQAALPEDGAIEPQGVKSAIHEQQCAPRMADNSCSKNCPSWGDDSGSDGNYCSART